MKKYFIIPMMLLTVSLLFSGCFAMDGSLGGSPQSTLPPQRDFKSAEELATAVAAAKASSAADDVNLKGLTEYYALKTVPDGAKLNYIKVSAKAVRVGYTFGQTSDLTYDNQMELAWYRDASATDFISQTTQSIAQYDMIESKNLSYVHSVPTLNFVVTPEPGSTPEATPTPRSGTYCQFLYWVQDNAAFISAVPLSFTKDDIMKYCVAEKVAVQ